MIGLNLMQNDERLPGDPNVDQRLFGAKAEAAGAHQVHVDAALGDRVSERGVDAFGAVAGPASAHADGNARSGGLQLGEARAANRIECAQVANSRHGRVSRLPSASSSRASDRSFM